MTLHNFGLSKERIKEKVLNKSIDYEGIEIVQTSKQCNLWFCDLGTKEGYTEIYQEANPESFNGLIEQLHRFAGINLDLKSSKSLKHDLNKLT